MRVRCEKRQCGWVGDEGDLLSADNPFRKGERIYACPKCRAIDSTLYTCDEPGCDEFATCGWPSKGGYRHTCGKHMEKVK